MFSLKEFIKRGLLNAVGKMADYQVILNAAGWYDKGVLDDDDLVDIQIAIDNQYIKTECDIPCDAVEDTEEVAEETEKN